MDWGRGNICWGRREQRGVGEGETGDVARWAIIQSLNSLSPRPLAMEEWGRGAEGEGREERRVQVNGLWVRLGGVVVFVWRG